MSEATLPLKRKSNSLVEAEPEGNSASVESKTEDPKLEKEDRSPVKKKRISTEEDEIVFACDSCDYKDTIDKVRLHRSVTHHNVASRHHIGLKVEVDGDAATDAPRRYIGIDDYFSVEDTNRLRCRQCGMILQTRAVPFHIARCSSQRALCALCCRAFPDDTALRSHKLDYHHTCDVCGREFIDAGDFFQRHQDKCRKMKAMGLKSGEDKVETNVKT